MGRLVCVFPCGGAVEVGRVDDEAGGNEGRDKFIVTTWTNCFTSVTKLANRSLHYNVKHGRLRSFPNNKMYNINTCDDIMIPLSMYAFNNSHAKCFMHRTFLYVPPCLCNVLA
jgi:hypothetical protein